MTGSILTPQKMKKLLVIADACIGLAFDVAEKKKIKRAAFWSASVAILDVLQSFQKLIDDGVIDNDGEILH